MKLLTLARDLQRRRARERRGRFVAEGVRTVETLLDSGLTTFGILAAPTFGSDARAEALLARAEERQVPVYRVSDAQFAEVADTESPQGVLAVAATPDYALAPPAGAARYLVLDGVQDPGNVGTIIRTAAAFGVDGTLALPGTVDFWNAKVVRGSMGALFTHPVVAVSAADLREFVVAHAVRCWAADTSGIPLDDLPGPYPDRLALVVSNEGAGLSAAAAGIATERVAISMAPGVESLNVAVATGILLYSLRRSARASSGPMPALS